MGGWWVDGSSLTGGAGRGNELEGLGSAKHLSSDRRIRYHRMEEGERREGKLSRISGIEGIRSRRDKQLSVVGIQEGRKCRKGILEVIKTLAVKARRRAGNNVVLDDTRT